MRASAAERVEKAVAAALADRIIESESYKAAQDDLGTLRAINARTPSNALPRALAHLVRFFDQDDPQYKVLTEEGGAAIKAAEAAEPKAAPAKAPTQFTRPPARYQEVAPRTGEVPLDADMGWHLPILFEGAWVDADVAEAGALVDRIRSAFPEPWSGGVADGVRAVRMLPMTCYPGFDAVEVLFKFGDNPPISQVALLGPDIAFWVTGVSVGLHELNAMKQEDDTPFLDISTKDRALEYLRFFCSAVHGEEGPFRLIEDMDMFYEHMVGAPESEISAELVVPGEMIRGQDESDETAWETETAVLYSNALFRAKFRIKRSGMVEMLDDEPVASDLPALRQVMMQGLRQPRLVQSAKSDAAEA